MKMSGVNGTVKLSEVKREDFRKYLEHTGVLDALTNLLISFYEERERPDDALEYIRKHFGSLDINRPDSSELETLKKELSEAKSQIAELKEKLSKYESETL